MLKFKKKLSSCPSMLMKTFRVLDSYISERSVNIHGIMLTHIPIKFGSHATNGILLLCLQACLTPNHCSSRGCGHTSTVASIQVFSGQTWSGQSSPSPGNTLWGRTRLMLTSSSLRSLYYVTKLVINAICMFFNLLYSIHKTYLWQYRLIAMSLLKVFFILFFIATNSK